jgi:hypothetical protein
LAGALRAPIQAIPACSSARPSWVRLRCPRELLGERRRAVGILDEDRVEIRVERLGDAVAGHGLEQHRAIARGILLIAEHGSRDRPGRVVDPGDQAQVRPALLEPGVAAAVDLEQHPCPRSALAPAAVRGRAPGARRSDALARQDPAHRSGRQLGPAGLGHRLREVDRVEARELTSRETDDLGPDLVGDAVDGPPAAVGVDQRCRTLAPEARDEPPHLPGRAVEQQRCLLDAALLGEHVREHHEALLSRCVQGDRLPRLHGSESDKVAVPLGRTDSLSLDTAARVG